MSKFNLSKIRGAEKVLEEPNGMKVGLGLLNDASRGDMDLLYLERRQIQKNEKNFYKVGDIESLALSISEVGLKQPLEVKPLEGNQFELLSGERRLTAIDYLIEKGLWNKVIPCVVTELDKIDLPLTEEEKEMYCIITTNKEQRDYTDGEIAKELQELKKIYRKLKESGIPRLKNLDGSEIELKGRREREVLSEALGVSTGKISQFDKVEHQGSDSLVDAMMSDQISANTAAQVADLPKDLQEDFMQQMKKKKKEKIEGKDLSAYKKEVLSEPLEHDTLQKKEMEIPDGYYYMDGEEWQKDTESIRREIRIGKILREEVYFEYLKGIQHLERLIQDGEIESGETEEDRYNL